MCWSGYVRWHVSADEMAQLYRSVMTGLLDKHCPVVTVRRKTKHTTPWFDSESCTETTCDSCRTTFSPDLLWSRPADVALLHALYELKNSTYWRDETASSKGNMTKLWRSLSGVLGETSSDFFDDHSAANFAAFFTDKIDAVRASTATTPPYNVVHSATSTMDTAHGYDWRGQETDRLGTEQDMSAWSCPGAPTWLVKEVGLLSPSSRCCVTSRWLLAAFHQSLSKQSASRCWRTPDWIVVYWRTTGLFRHGLSSLSYWRGLCRVDFRPTLTATTWCQKHSLPTVPSTAQKRHIPKCTMICCLLLMVDRKEVGWNDVRKWSPIQNL